MLHPPRLARNTVDMIGYHTLVFVENMRVLLLEGLNFTLTTRCRGDSKIHLYEDTSAHIRSRFIVPERSRQ
jgi:hypothetical protein